MIFLTESAAGALRSAMARSTKPVNGLRIAVESGGCAGNKYLMGLVEDGKSGDMIFEREGVKVFVDPSSATILNGTTIDYVSSLEGAGFTFDNPQASSSCSCGKSFS